VGTIIPGTRLEFARARGDTLHSGLVTLDVNGPQYLIVLSWLPIVESWSLTMIVSSGDVIVSGAAVRDRTDCLMGVSTPGRPRGAIAAYDPKGRGDPTLDSFSRGGVMLLYLPDGLDPAVNAMYSTEVA